MNRLPTSIAAVLLLALGTLPSRGAAQRRPAVDRQRLGDIDRVVRRAIARGELPGAVVLITHRGEVVFRKAYGLRAKLPASVPMTCDTVFDLASLTKPVATATSVMILREQGKLRLSDRVVAYRPAFGQNGKDRITLEQLLLHTSGLIADNPVADYRDGPVRALEQIDQLRPVVQPGSRFIYSDVNYIVLGEIVHKVSGVALDEFARRHIFAPLGMKETCFRPTGALKARAAPTERRAGHWMAGEVHDPRAYALGGVAGHAGLFSTADDLAVYARMILGGGQFAGHRVLSAASVREMTRPRTVPLRRGQGMRALGWDVQTPYSSNRGDLFPRGESFGHTGFTGTSIWMDPASETAVILLSNRVHPDGKGDVKRVRGEVATIAAAAVGLSGRR
jgi:CubicO group peptidase (beta-lactamase class C family)